MGSLQVLLFTACAGGVKVDGRVGWMNEIYLNFITTVPVVGVSKEVGVITKTARVASHRFSGRANIFT